MENKKFMGIPKDDLGKVILSGVIYEQSTGKKITKKELLENLNKLNIRQTKEAKSELKKAFPHIELD